ncbi:glycosyltransferase family 39 protein [bacterium]|nr:glycosyltransferase family 39 protein [bacterium]MCP5462665.1 glycosyltransferase family 39 protein [bacterium]
MAEPIEKKVQDFVVGVDKFSPKAIKITIWMTVSLVLFFISFALLTSYPIRLNQIDAIDYAQIARNFSRGEGITTKFIRPVSLRFFPHYENHPELTSPPLYPIILGTFLKLFDKPGQLLGEIDRKVIIFGSGLFFLLSVPLFSWLAFKLVGRNVAYLALFFYVTNIIVLKNSVSALPDMLLTTLLLSLVLALFYYEGSNIFKPVLIGAILGLCYLTRYSFSLCVFPVLFYIFIKAKRYKLIHAVMFLVTFLVVIFPWLLRNYRITGNPFFTLEWYKFKMFTEVIPGNLFWRSYVEQVFNRELDFFFMLRKFCMGIKNHYAELLSITNNFLFGFFIVSLFAINGKNKQNRIKWLIMLLLVIQLAVSAYFWPGANVIFPFVPLMIMFAVELFYELLSRKKLDPFMRIAVILIFVAMNCVPTLFAYVPKLFQEDMYRSPKKYWEDDIITAARSLKPRSVLISDVPWAIAWYGNITSIWLPWGTEDFNNITEKFGQIQGCYFSPMVLRYPQDEDKIWLKFYSYLIRYRKAPENNIFEWYDMKSYTQGDVFCVNKDALK